MSLGGAQPLLLWVEVRCQGALRDGLGRRVPGMHHVRPRCRGGARRQACASGLTVVSGGALGIDSHAHTGALEAGGKTVLVAAGGAGQVYRARTKSCSARLPPQVR